MFNLVSAYMVRIAYAFLYLAGAIAMGGCVMLVASSTRNPVDLYWNQPEFLTRLQNPYVEQVPPVVTARGSVDFRYGRFCGKGWPNFQSDERRAGSGRPPPQEEQAALLEKYLRTSPVDNLDKACKRHDICWLINGDGDGYCNQTLMEDAARIIKPLQFLASSSKGSGCNALAIDIASSTLVMEQLHGNPLLQLNAVINKFHPFTLGLGISWLATSKATPYPDTSQIGNCNGNMDFDKKTGVLP